MRQSATKPKLIMNINSRSPISEGYRNVRTNIQFSSWKQKLQVMAVTSTQAGEGKTTTISNLAVSYAQEGKRVLLIDADLRHPSVQDIFHLANKMGLSNILAYQCSADELIRITDIDNLSIVTAGPIPPNPTELLSSGRMHEVVESWKGDYDIILIDTSPIMAVADGIIVASICDGVILVVQAGKVKQEYIQKSKERLEHVKAHIIGVVLNNKKLNKSESNQYNYYSHLD
ncbi:capsular biosynthesis protein [Paenibacillus macquariensis subsp. macquariensis]|uniref:non-specific protein-tyrosine kinase n=2 Tax=Paenibacillus macquariensis TaxID=948756 RepID=A0ABY1KB92_9BACL|nr:CpsD/CapB family tyrosine-protein kinase [Paenibacillus macquariensis]MEC0094216.1 CpsD/CapB family tyrosine-protein kinase [Paenibacillus macquariensis]OAB32111.1 capsular biosynthesis protein [Paenibacillus macquariensis subsp. macquariensis]SIR54684.1 capsular exopolysaccharide family [Paenibacillus macquariensis]